MANTSRRKEYIDRNNNMFIPMNVEGGVWNENFITTGKLMWIVGCIVALVVLIGTLKSNEYRWPAYLIYGALWAWLSSLVFRYIVFEEKFYYRMYKKLEQYEVTTPAIFWDISSMKDTPDGAILTFSDAKIAVLVKLDRDTITGKDQDFEETHYDAISDFYRSLSLSAISFVQMNIMEPAGKDPRLIELSKLMTKSDNPSICKLMELEVGHIKNITNSSLYESDYFLFYSYNLSKVDSIIDDVSECIFKILDGAYVGFTILNSTELVELQKERFGVKYFNATEASLLMMGNGKGTENPFDLTGIVWDDDYTQTLTRAEINKLKSTTSSIIKNQKNQKDILFKDIIYRKNAEDAVGIDLDEALEKHSRRFEDAIDTSTIQEVNAADLQRRQRRKTKKQTLNAPTKEDSTVAKPNLEKQTIDDLIPDDMLDVTDDILIDTNDSENNIDFGGNANQSDDIIDFGVESNEIPNVINGVPLEGEKVIAVDEIESDDDFSNFGAVKEENTPEVTAESNKDNNEQSKPSEDVGGDWDDETVDF